MWAQQGPRRRAQPSRPSAARGADTAPNRRWVFHGAVRSPASSPMSSISSQPEKASLTLCISAHVDSLLLLVI